MKNKFVYIIALLLLIVSFHNFIYASKKDDNVILKKVEIKYGDTIWDIAKNNISEGEDIRNYIYEIRKINNLEEINIYPGKVILVPVKIK